MHDPEKSDSGIVAMKPMNKAGATGGGVGGAKAGDQGKRGPTKHAPDAEPGSRDPGVGPGTKSCKAKQEGAVHFARPPHRKGSSARVSPIRSATVVRQRFFGIPATNTDIISAQHFWTGGLEAAEVSADVLAREHTVFRARQGYALKRKAAPGVDGMMWADYEADLEPWLEDLHGRVHRGAYRPRPSRRTYIPKADGKQRPLATAALETRSSRAQPSCYSTQSMKATSAASPTGFGRDEDRTMRWMHFRRRSK